MFLFAGGIVVYSKDKPFPKPTKPQFEPVKIPDVPKPESAPRPVYILRQPQIEKKTEKKFYIDLNRNGKLVEISKNEVAWAKKNGFKVVEQ
jgi:hypothetical protein